MELRDNDGVGRGERLVGRADTRAVLAAALDDAGSGDGQFVLISGEAGIGKSVLLSWLVEQAEPGFRVLRGLCLPGSGVPPYWPWVQMLRATGLSTDELGEAVELLGTDPNDGPHDAAAAADARFRLLDALRRVLADLAGARPLVVVLDDLHWADEQSLAALGFLTRALAASPVLFVGAYRDTEAPPTLAEHGGAQHLPLTGLALAEVEAMVAAMPGTTPAPGRVAQIWRRSGGNPFFVRELIRLLQAQGTGELPNQLPAGVSETIRRRLARLSTECVRLLDWAAVAGRDIDIPLLVRSGAVADEATAHALLEQARQFGVIAPGDPPRFTHDLFRDAILDALTATADSAINLAIGRALQATASPGGAGRIAAHLLRSGPQARGDAVDFSILAAREATSSLGHNDAADHYQRALDLLDTNDERRLAILLDLAAARERAGASEPARQCYREAADEARRAGDSVTLGRVAVGMQRLGHRSGAQNAEVLDLLREAADWLETGGDPLLHSRVLAATVRARRHSEARGPGPDLIELAHRAAQLADAAGDLRAVADAKLALHDALWVPGSSGARLAVADQMLQAAHDAGDADLIAIAHQLRAAALLELGDPRGRDELQTYITLAEELGHARGRWGALTRKATYAQIAGRAQEAARFGEEALALGQAIGEPDASGCFYTFRWSLIALGVREPAMLLDDTDPLWPMFPLFRAWAPAVRGELQQAREALGDFSVLDIVDSWGLEPLAVTAVVFAAVGNDEQRRWAYEQLKPHAGMHVVVGGCASYHAAVDHHLGTLAASLGDRQAALVHYKNAVAMHRTLGAAGWERISERALAAVVASDAAPVNEFRLINGLWSISYAGTTVHLPDAKGLHDLSVLISAKGKDVHAHALLDPNSVPDGRNTTGADPVLDDTAKAQYRARLDALATDIAAADELGHSERASRLADERDALIHELAAATGLGGRARRLGDETERARKTVGARLRDTLARIDRVHPALGAHLRAAVRMGTTCSYTPAEPTSWRLR